MDEPRDVKDLADMNGMERREFLQKLIAAALAIPSGGLLLLSGCDGGVLGPQDGQPPVPQGNLDEEVQAMRDAITAVMNAVRALQGAGDADIAGWMAQLNAQLAVVWPLMVAAAQQDLRDNVSPEMATVLAQLDQFGDPLRYSGPAPTVTQQRLQAAWDRAEGLMQPTAAGDEPYATPATWAYFLMLFLIFPTITNADAFNYAMAAVGMETGHGTAANLYSLLHPAGGISCTPCFISGVIGGLLPIVGYLFLAMGSHAATAPSMLFGRDWLILLVLLAVLLVLFLI